VAVVEHRGEVAGDEGGALQRVVVALGRAVGDVQGLRAVGQRVEGRAGGDLRGHVEGQLGLVHDALHPRVEARVLRARLGIAHPEERRPLGARVRGGNRDHRQTGLHRDGLARVQDAAATQRHEAVGLLGERRGLADTADLGMRARAVKALGDRQFDVLPELLGDEQRLPDGELGEDLRQRIQTPADDHAGTIPHVRLPCIVGPSDKWVETERGAGWRRTVGS
jgi:hypothetical protein